MKRGREEPVPVRGVKEKPNEEEDTPLNVPDLHRKRRKHMEEINSWIPPSCCRRNCARQIGVEELRGLRWKFLGASRDNRKNMLASLILMDCDRASFAINGWRPCWKLLINSLDTSRTLLSNVLGLPSANASSCAGRLGGRDGSRSLKSGVIAFLEALADDVADEIPNVVERHLPHGNKKLVFLLYQENEMRYSRRPCKQSHFYRIWKEFAPYIKCRRSHCFTVCDTCTQFKEELLRLARITGQDSKRAQLKKGFSKHLKHVQIERAEYRRVQNTASERPGEVLSVIIDGADQAKFALPRLPSQTKRESGNALKQKITGVLFHGALDREDLLFFLTSADNLPSGANQTIDSLCRCMLFLFEKREAKGMERFPDELNIQLDNTSKDNKNRFFFAFCEYLIHIGLFLRINVRFLPVGHTHEDIDRKFSRVSVYLKERVIATVDDLHLALRMSQPKKQDVIVTRVHGLFNFSGAIREQKLVTDHVKNMLSFQKFVFERDSYTPQQSTGQSSQGQLVLSTGAFKMSAKRDEWTRLKRKEGDVGAFLKQAPHLGSAPDVSLKKYSEQDIHYFRNRIRTTEGRIKDAEKVSALKNELHRIATQETARSDWNFSKVEFMAGRAARSRRTGNHEEQVDEEESFGDVLSYEVDEMVTVNCGASLNDLTPFWLARIEHVDLCARREAKLRVRWYEVHGRRRGNSNCFNCRYRPMSGNTDALSDIPGSSILVNFDCLTTEGKIPDFVQRLTREALDPFGEDEESQFSPTA